MITLSPDYRPAKAVTVFVLIKYHEKVLKGCVGCNLWGRIGGRAWTHLPSHDLRVLESMLHDMTRKETGPAA
jgi:hypothetical protein